MKRVHVEVTLKVIVDIEETEDISEVLENTTFEVYTDSQFYISAILDTQVLNYEVTDSR